jgi:glycosyltransferase involved in cell wall biosynthesis
MRFLHFSSSDGPGGAGRAALRLHAALRGADHDSRILVRGCNSGDADVAAMSINPLVAQIRRLKKHLPWIRPAPSRFTFNHDLESGIRWRRAIENESESPDVICLHWVADFLTSRDIRSIHDRMRCPMLWVMMDQEPVTGGCHYSFGCQGYQAACGNCPVLMRPRENDCSRKVFLRKRAHLADLPITFVAPTAWVEERVRASALFGGHRTLRIGLPIDTSIFHTGDRAAARRALGIAPDKRVVFFGSSYLDEPRKGAAYLVDALWRLRKTLEAPPASVSRRDERHLSPGDILLLISGKNGDDLKRQLPFAGHELGYLTDERRLATAYRAADVFVCPSIEDAGPMMIPEAMLCGTPVVAFAMGGAPDLVTSGQTGYLARLRDAGDMAHGIEQVLWSPARDAMGQTAARRALALHEPRVVAEQYSRLVAELAGSGSLRRAAA